MLGRTHLQARRDRPGHDLEPADVAVMLARSRASMRAMLDATTSGILVADSDSQLCEFNDRFVSMWPMPPGLTHVPDERALLAWIASQFADPAAFRARFVDVPAHARVSADKLQLRDGRMIELHFSPQLVGGTAVGGVWSFTDITASWHAQATVEDEQEQIGWLNRIWGELTLRLEPDAVAQAATDAATRISGARFGWFIPKPATPDEELPTAFSADAQHPRHHSIIHTTGRDAIQQATREWQQAFHCDDLERDNKARQLFLHPDRLTLPLSVRSLLVIPVSLKAGKVLGALAFEHPTAGGFTERVQRQVGTVAAQAAIVINHALMDARARKGSKDDQLLARLQRSTGLRLQSLTRRLMDVEEDERKRLGRELHDRVGANLSALGMGLELLRQQVPQEEGGPIARRLLDLTAIVTDTATHVRTVLADLRPPALDELGLVAALRHQATVLTSRCGIQFVVEGSEPSPRLTPQCEIAFFRIAQEAWANVMKHSAAKSVTVAVSQVGPVVSMAIEDDGQGFDPSALLPGTPSLGLTTMRERAEAIGAVLELESAVGAGMSVRLSLLRTP